VGDEPQPERPPQPASVFVDRIRVYGTDQTMTHEEHARLTRPQPPTNPAIAEQEARDKAALTGNVRRVG
jgi:hypothetical protein